MKTFYKTKEVEAFLKAAKVCFEESIVDGTGIEEILIIRYPNQNIEFLVLTIKDYICEEDFDIVYDLAAHTETLVKTYINSFAYQRYGKFIPVTEEIIK